MHLKLRRKKPPLLPPRAVEGSRPSHKSFIHKPLYKMGNPATPPSKLAADVHLCFMDYCRESSAVQKKILIVDDSPSQVKLMQGLLEPEGYWPVGLSDPKRVEETIASNRPSVILLDVVMPERNGFQICRDLKGNADFNTIPVILVTSKDTPSDRYWGEQQGADGYVTKPFTREELLRAVRRFA
jgi:twitching motility two-component system response regulator PilH